MTPTLRMPLALLVIGLAGSLGAVDITPDLEKVLAQKTEVLKGWAASPIVVKAVLDRNEKGPIAGMDNEKWKSVRRTDDVVKDLSQNGAAKFLGRKISESDGLYLRAFLNGARGEKAAFTEKTISYLHAGQAKFDVPFTTGKTWQGKPELDTVTEIHGVQIAVPVLSRGKPVGVLVVGVNLSKLSNPSSKP
ncbi:MAG TPA: hypothetical protein VMV60_06990 [Thermoanaerobaculia bacterium]|nr:hypothetical protein [Thermoanaerobaculia bacterium]